MLGVSLLSKRLAQLSVTRQWPKASIVRTLATKDNSQHEEWMKFQDNLKVKAVGDTGSSERLAEAIANLGNRSNAMRKKMVKTLTRGGSISASEVGGGLYPPCRLSDEETEALLKEAYANIPSKTGKRGTRKLKREKRRWRLVRQIRKKYKKSKIRAHFRKMAKRGAITRECQAIRANAHAVRDTDQHYQMIVLKGWAKKTLMSNQLMHASVQDSK